MSKRAAGAITALVSALAAGAVAPASAAGLVSAGLAATGPVASGTPGGRVQAVLNRTPSGGTVTLGPGVFELEEPLQVPAGVTLRGSGRNRTVLQLSREHWAEFSYDYLIRPAGNAEDVTVRDLTVDGSRSGPAGTPQAPENAGGGIKAGSGWKVTGVRFTNLNYFKVWVFRVRDVVVADNRFDADGGSSGDKDNVGGGRSQDVIIRDNVFAASTGGSAVDIVGSSGVKVIGNRVNGTDSAEHSIYLEGVRDSVVAGNRVDHGAITVQTDKQYELKRPIANPQGIRVSGNTVVDAPAQGIGIIYDTGRRGRTAGGGNVVRDNTVIRSGRSGILLLHCAEAATMPDVIEGNVVKDAFARSESTWGTGCGTVGSSGITVTGGVRPAVHGNTVSDTRSPSGVRFAVWLGADGARAALTAPRVSGTTADGTGLQALGGVD